MLKRDHFALVLERWEIELSTNARERSEREVLVLVNDDDLLV
jgi:hypothetical protein